MPLPGRTLPLIPLLAAAAGLALSGCTSAVLGGGAAVGVAAAQERSVGAAVDDTVIYTDITARIFAKNVDLFSAVGVEVVEGRVLLTGSVKRPEDRVEAVRLAWQVKGVREVINEIQVSDTSSLSNFARDSWISAQLRSKLLLDKQIESLNYNVETVNGIVYMIGIAQNEAELKRATNLARTIPHVREVVSHVRIKNPRED